MILNYSGLSKELVRLRKLGVKSRLVFKLNSRPDNHRERLSLLMVIQPQRRNEVLVFVLLKECFSTSPTGVAAFSKLRRSIKETHLILKF